jgi:hypothetical protein
VFIVLLASLLLAVTAVEIQLVSPSCCGDSGCILKESDGCVAVVNVDFAKRK